MLKLKNFLKKLWFNYARSMEHWDGQDSVNNCIVILNLKVTINYNI